MNRQWESYPQVAREHGLKLAANYNRERNLPGRNACCAGTWVKTDGGAQIANNWQFVAMHVAPEHGLKLDIRE